MGLTANVVPGAPILAPWGNEVRDRSVQVFATIAERSSQWTSPPAGAMSYITSTGRLYLFNASAWVCITPASSSLIASQNMTGTTYGDLPGGAGPSVSVETGGAALVSFSVTAALVGGALNGACAVAVTGATTIVANDNNSVAIALTSGASIGIGRTFLLAGLNAGANVFTLKYKTDTGTTAFARRDLTVVGVP